MKVIKNSGHLPRERVAEDFVWAQWDMSEQRLYYIDLKKSRSILKCIQFYSNEHFTVMSNLKQNLPFEKSVYIKLVMYMNSYAVALGEREPLEITLFEAPLDISLSDSGFKLVNFGCDDLRDQEKLSKHLTLYVFTNRTGHSKTFTVALGSVDSRVTKGITFLNLGNNEVIDMLPHRPFQSLSGPLVLDGGSGKLYRVLLNQSYLLEFLRDTRLDCERMALLHCVLSCGRDPRRLEAKEIPGITLVTEEIPLPLMKVHSFKGYWEKLNSNLEYAKYSKPHLHYNNGVVRREWHSLISEEREREGKLCDFSESKSLLFGHHIFVMEAPKIRLYGFHRLVLSVVRALLCFHTLHTILGVHCLPLHNLLHYIDNGVLLLTETAVTRLMKDLDNTEKNEKLKFSIIVRLPPRIGQKICRLWDHPMSSNIISRNHVKRLLQDYSKQPRSSVMDKSSFSLEFLPLNYFIEILTDVESSNPALYAFEGHDNVDAKFVEEAALKHTTMLLGL
ncbi:pigeon-like protein [Camelus ferus]|nr:pigeon-like protein [Camelus ferus]